MPEPKLLFVINKAEIGGAELHTLALAEGLKTRGFEAAVFALKPGGAAAGRAILTPPAAQPFSLRRRIRDLRERIAQGRCDIVVGVNTRPMAAAAVARWGLSRRPRAVGVAHSTKLRSFKAHALEVCHYPLFHSLDRFIFISENQRAYWRKAGFRPARALTILNGVDTRHFSVGFRGERRAAARAALDLPPDDIVVALSAMLRPEKNHLQCLDALAHLRAQGAPVRGLLIGDGPHRARIEARMKTLGLDRAVAIAGLQSDVRPCLAAADIGLNCSTAIETLSLSALETLAMGVPMAMSDIGGASEIIDDQCGALFPAGRLDALCAALARFFDPGRRAAAGRAARARVEAAFDQSRMFDRYAEAFAALARE